MIQAENRAQAARSRIWGVITRPEHSRARRPLAPWLPLPFLLLLAFVGCAEPPTEETEIESVDVTSGLEVDTSGDEVAKAREPELVGILPGDFPRDLPLHLPASIVDIEDSKAGRPVVSFLTPHEISGVRRALDAKLRAAGWESSAGSGSTVLKKGGQRAWLSLEDGRPGTLYRYEYKP